ncbi:hypothetical protein PENFLA_c010G02493 [Penicillium flavigenum]|uniref:DUF7703 domain-containing protein n=1 Tax=Penicillium flavigenum TaxID=254877 RepID=A0A1V6TCG3_9EURO|nr:hypothetical protein PENFLA_c010G02493 [Penicillium flavigenum]
MRNSLLQNPDEIIGGYHGGTLAIRIVMIVFSTIALYNSVELIVLVFASFSHYHGLYFWALFLSVALGVIPYTIGYLCEFFSPSPAWLSLTLATIGFYVMVPGQSVVLYSRLHLIVRNHKVLRLVLWFIIIDTVILLVPTTTLVYLIVYVSTNPTVKGYNVIERMELAWFCAQEFVLTGIYISETVKLIKIWPGRDRRRLNIMYQLLAINALIIIFDFTLLILEYVGYHSLQVTLKPMVYSIKLKLEFAVLGKLVALVQPHHVQQSYDRQHECLDFVNAAPLASDISQGAE